MSWRQEMRFRYVDVRKLNVVGVFENEQGNMFFWTERQIKKRIKNYKQIGDWDAVVECQEALESIQDRPTPWWKFW